MAFCASDSIQLLQEASYGPPILVQLGKPPPDAGQAAFSKRSLGKGSEGAHSSLMLLAAIPQCAVTVAPAQALLEIPSGLHQPL